MYINNEFLPNIDKKELFTQIKNIAPVRELINKQFSLIGVTENTEVVQNHPENSTGNEQYKNKITLFTDKGCFYSFSSTLNGDIYSLYSVYGDEVKTLKLTIKKTERNDKTYYDLIIEG